MSSPAEGPAADDLVAVGYLLLRPLPRTSFFSVELLPPLITSASDCLCPRFPDAYAIDWSSTSADRRAEAFAKIGIPPAEQARARAWATLAFDNDFGWPSVFYTAEGAVEAKRAFLSASPDARVIGLGLERNRLEGFLELAAPQSLAGGAPGGESGTFTTAKRRAPLAPGGRALGFEPLSLQLGELAHSWLCNHLETHVSTALGIRPNAEGLLGTLADARRVCEEISNQKVGAEPGPWFPVALVEYGRA